MQKWKCFSWYLLYFNIVASSVTLGCGTLIGGCVPHTYHVFGMWKLGGECFPTSPMLGNLVRCRGDVSLLCGTLHYFCSMTLKVNLKEHKNIKTLKQMRIFISAIVFQIFMFIFFKNFGRGCFSIPTSPHPGNLVKHWLCLYTSMIVCFGLAC